MTEVILHGALARQFGKRHKFFIRKPIDAIRALMVNKKGFKKAFRTWGMEGKFYEMICDGEVVETLYGLEQTNNIKTIHLAPTIIGTSNAAKIIVGAALIVLSFYVPGSWGAFGEFLGDALLGAGISLVMGGIMGLLFPPPTPSFTDQADAKSFLFSSLENSTVQGVVVPLGYGRLIVGSKVISSSLEPMRLSNTSTATFTRPVGSAGGGIEPSPTDPIEFIGGGGGGGGTYPVIPYPTLPSPSPTPFPIQQDRWNNP